MAETAEGERALRILIPGLEAGRNLIYSHGAVVPSNVPSAPPGGGSQEEKGTIAGSGLNSKQFDR